MGQSSSSFKLYYADEFERLRGKKTYLVASELLHIKTPRSPYVVSTGHIGVLYLLDRDHDGRVTLEDIQAFIDMAADCSERFKRHEYQYLMQGYCMVLLWNVVHTDTGRREFCDWLSKAVTQGCDIQVKKKAFRSIQCVEARAVEVLYEVMEMQGMNKVSLADLMRMCQDELAAAGGSGAALDAAGTVEDGSDLGNYVPLQAIRRFGESVVDGIAKVMGGVYESDDMLGLQAPVGYGGH